jgi:hypothetical protein
MSLWREQVMHCRRRPVPAVDQSSLCAVRPCVRWAWAGGGCEAPNHAALRRMRDSEDAGGSSAGDTRCPRVMLPSGLSAMVPVVRVSSP